MSTSKRRSMYSDAFGEFENKLIEDAEKISTIEQPKEKNNSIEENSSIPANNESIDKINDIEIDIEEKIRGTRPVRMVSVLVEDPETGEVRYEKRKKENKTSQITILVTSTENKIIRAKAKENDVTLNQYLRDIILKHVGLK